MVKEKRILSYFFGWLLLGYIILFIGTNNVYAETVIVPVKYVTSETNLIISNNTGGEIQLSPSISNSNSIDIKSIIMNIDYSFKANIIYQIELSTPTQNLINVNNVTILSNDNACSFKSLTDTSISFPKVQFSCPFDTNYITISLSNNSNNNITSSYNFRWNYTYLSIVNENVVDLDPVIDGQEQINENITGSTNTITGAITDTENNINSNIDNMEESINGTIKDNFNDCRPSKNLFDAYNITFGTPHNASYIINDSNSITVTNNGGWSRVYATIKDLKPNTFYTISADMINNNNIPAGLWINDNNNSLQYNDSRVIVRTTSNGSIDFQFYTNWKSTPNYGQVIYNNIQIEEGSSATTFEKPGEICQNKIDETNDKLDETNNQLGDLNNNITNDSAPNTSDLQNSAGWLPPGPLDSVLNLPLSLFNALTTNLNKSCNPINIPLPYVNKNITLPCINTLYNQIGITSFLSWIGVIVSGLMLYTYLLKLYKWIEDRISLNETHNVDSWGGL